MSIVATDLRLHRKSRLLEIRFDSGDVYQLSCEYLRVMSPSAEVRGHSPSQAVLQVGKESVNIDEIHPVGHYAVLLVFDDGHRTGIYSWDYLYELGSRKAEYWQRYLDQLTAAGHQRKETAA